MQVYKISADSSSYRFVTPGCGRDAWADVEKELSGFETYKDRWQAKQLFFWNGLEKPIGDFFSLGDSALIGVNYSARRARVVWKMLERAGELLPIDIEDFGEALVLHVLSTGEALDWDRSISRRISSGNRVVYKPVVRLSRLNPGEIVRLKDLPLQILVTGENDTCRLQRDYMKCNLTGLHFEAIQGVVDLSSRE